MKRRGVLLIMVSLVLAIFAAWVARNWVYARLSAGATREPTQTVVVAALEIPFGEKVEARHLKTITLPSNAALGNHFEKTDDVVGLLALQKSIPGEILLKEHFADRNAGSTLAAIVKPDMRAVTVRVDDVIGVAGFLLPGNRVDVVAARMVENRAVTETVLRNHNVLAVDQSASQDKDQPAIVRAVTLEVTPKQAEILVRSREEGKIQLTLRNPLDKNSAPDAEPAPPVVAAAQPPAATKHHQPPRPRPAGESVTIIRGTNINNAAPSI